MNDLLELGSVRCEGIEVTRPEEGTEGGFFAVDIVLAKGDVWLTSRQHFFRYLAMVAANAIHETTVPIEHWSYLPSPKAQLMFGLKAKDYPFRGAVLQAQSAGLL